jgi:hypothetical protein
VSPIRVVRGQSTEAQAASPKKGMSMSPWKRWFIGAANALISGVTSGGMAQFVGVGAKKSLIIAGGSAFVSFCKYFAQHPLPGAD